MFQRVADIFDPLPVNPVDFLEIPPKTKSEDANGVDLSTGFQLRTHGLGSSNLGVKISTIDRSLTKKNPIPLGG